MPNFNFDPQQQQPGNVFSWIDQALASLPVMTPWPLGFVGGIAGFSYANMHGAQDYTVLLVVAGFLGGFLLIQLIGFALKALVAATIVAVIALIALWLFGYQSAHHGQTPAPTGVPAHVSTLHIRYTPQS